MKQYAERLLWATIFVALFLALKGEGGTPFTTKADRVVLVHEKDTPIPSGVLAALNTLNRQGILATAFDQDTTDGSGETPEQYKVPLAAGKEAGLPALVVMAGGKVLRVVKAPTTETVVLEAVK